MNQMISITYLLCIALKSMQWPLWGIIGTGIIDWAIVDSIAQAFVEAVKCRTLFNRKDQ